MFLDISPKIFSTAKHDHQHDEQPSPKHTMDQKLLSHAAVIDMSKESKFHSFTLYIIRKISFPRVEHYRVESSTHGQENNFLLAQRLSNNLTTPLNQLTMVCKLNMHTHYDNKLVINLNKFGSYWFFASHVYNGHY
ncbi:hypothetical protein PHYBLDRAFT_163939 [Phycomyces blakesleeanus NRRL 1555(-)]|uniref:Uncharacterized protein n=1 Tax=Phycomyces blakesleeanus (strain ATCC 8743b / DSM 1359 / FGSC 10004 / NBRC 33097 / NRRL 1555) TaxID=763407 RepID=A0A162Y7S8_PHYB8|nr:hypothetical protein PHYBLDRAFT_163939 [Phycomyces blakesleeanus NRRL 1555(-)]OAD78845.1 hypothetical protein PHYBLDRAFT_163939 [Phycomyces blakesleeanus NRRL 1555(-)]|eukprot:XP_018296885.1 hypothetical protein PHYBLDRAFT_163939 [Phycomyces blakesleeanus NRRL 1555(-)]